MLNKLLAEIVAWFKWAWANGLKPRSNEPEKFENEEEEWMWRIK